MNDHASMRDAARVPEDDWPARRRRADRQVRARRRRGRPSLTGDRRRRRIPTVEKMRAQMGAAPIETTKLAEGVVMLSGPGGNVVVLTGREGKIVVDSFVQPAWPRLKSTLDGIDGSPIKTLIDTHWHFDHADNNANFRAAGAGILAHENTRKRLTETHDLLGMQFEPAPAGSIADRDLCRSPLGHRQRRADHPGPRAAGAYRHRHPGALHQGERPAHGRSLLQRHVSVHRRQHEREHQRHDRQRRPRPADGRRSDEDRARPRTGRRSCARCRSTGR